METSLGTVFLSEVAGTGMLLLLGCGVVANVALAKTKGAGGGFLLVNWGWGLAVFAGVYVAFRSGAHLNPAVTLGILANDVFDAEKGADTEERLGPTRAVASGLISPSSMRRAMVLAFGLATICGAYLVYVAGWPVIAISGWCPWWIVTEPRSLPSDSRRKRMIASTPLNSYVPEL